MCEFEKLVDLEFRGPIQFSNGSDLMMALL